VKRHQFVHILSQEILDAFNSNHIEVCSITNFIITHKITLLSAAKSNPCSVNVFLYVHNTPQHSTTLTTPSSILSCDTNSSVRQNSDTSTETVPVICGLICDNSQVIDICVLRSYQYLHTDKRRQLFYVLLEVLCQYVDILSLSSGLCFAIIK
jgi:hypothetical protein